VHFGLNSLVIVLPIRILPIFPFWSFTALAEHYVFHPSSLRSLLCTARPNSDELLGCSVKDSFPRCVRRFLVFFLDFYGSTLCPPMRNSARTHTPPASAPGETADRAPLDGRSCSFSSTKHPAECFFLWSFSGFPKNQVPLLLSLLFPAVRTLLWLLRTTPCAFPPDMGCWLLACWLTGSLRRTSGCSLA